MDTNKNARTEGNDPIDKNREVQQTNDERIDQDFPGFPDQPATPAKMSAGTANPRQPEETDEAQNRSGVSQRFDQPEESRESAQLPNSEKREQAIEDEAGVPQNVDNEDLQQDRPLPGTNPEEAGRS